jgi:sirohydrochlorin cobaltochelatase
MEMSLTGAITQRDGRTIRYARTLGEHPYPGQVIQQRIEHAVNTLNVPSDQIAVALIGHGTKLNPTSRTATEDRAQVVRDAELVAEVVAVYLDDTPSIPELYDMTTAPYIIAIPYFLAAGSHTTQDVPEALGLQSGQTTGNLNGRILYYTAPVGDANDPALTHTIIELAREAGTPLRPPTECTAWDGFPTAGRRELIQVMLEARGGGLDFGQLHLTPDEVRIIGVSDDNHSDLITSPSQLRRRVRGGGDNFRPLTTSNDLPGGWYVKIESPQQLHGVVETVYPGAVADWAAQQNGQFTVTPLDALIERQTGMFRDLSQMDFDQTATVVQKVCGGCVRQPTWFDKGAGGGEPQTRKMIPCREACNLWLSKALEMKESETKTS